MENLKPKQVRILVVDDDEAARNLLEEILDMDDYSVRSAASGEEALAAVAQQLPDLILLDVAMSGIDGFEVARRLKADSRSRLAPIILVTALADRTARLKGLEAGADEFLTKPVDRAELRVRVKNLLKIKEYNDFLADHNRILEEQVAANTTELRESEARYRRITEGFTDYLYTVHIENGRAVETTQNPACVTVTGYTAKEFAADPDLWLQMVVPEDRDRVLEHVRKILAGQDGTPIEHRITRKDGEMRWVSDTTILFKDASGKLLSYDGVIKDITARKRVEVALQENEAKYRLLIESLQEGIWMIDKDANTSFVNLHMAQMLGYSVEEMLGRHLFSFMDERGKEIATQKLERRRQGIKEQHDFEFLRKDGSRIVVAMETAPILDEAGNYTGALAGVMDITERQRAEAEIQRANRALTTLCAVNHALVHATDENTLLRAICDAIVEQNGYRMAWVGYVQHDEHKSIRIMARAGQDEGYLDAMQLTWAETEHGMRPCGRAIRSSATQVCQDIAHDPRHLPWHDAALKRGYATSIALPLARRGGKVFGTLAVYSDEVNAFGPAEVALLEEMAGDLAFGVRTLQIRHERNLAQDKVQQQVVQLQDSLEDTVRAIATIVEMRDPYTSGHQVKVADLATAIAKQIGLPDEQVHALHLAGIVHDLGKIKIPAEILSKPGRINDIEFRLIKVHPQAGYDILKDIDFPWPIAQMVLQHHERLDGSGYPQGLKGDQIILEARILGVADVVEAMSSHRPYRPGLGIDVALAEITRQRGTHYDPQVVDACLAVFREQHYSFKEGGGLSLPDGSDNAGDRGLETAPTGHAFVGAASTPRLDAGESRPGDRSHKEF